MPNAGRLCLRRGGRPEVPRVHAWWVQLIEAEQHHEDQGSLINVSERLAYEPRLVRGQSIRAVEEGLRILGAVPMTVEEP